ncbi:unnamed protein product [Spirodela intermedia]|uniref:Uncharacterized protein n=1 Tax=Spirodela intermedia TaxID=51605 RepID=A0A7I8KR24_SPIIN|nr:unnamed protein product [Spirodela intermedia]
MAAMRATSRHIFRRFSSGGKVLSEEEKAAENVYIKKVEREKLEKLARKGAQQGEQPSGAAGGATATDAGATGTQAGASTAGSSAEKSTNYLAIGGGVAALAAIGWYFGTRSKKSEEVKN